MNTRAMRYAILLIGFAFVAGCAGGAASSGDQKVIVSDGPRHPVTEKMRGVTDRLTNGEAPMFVAPMLLGGQFDSAKELKRGPLVIYSIKEDCPCSTDFEPFANSFSERYKSAATVVGLFNTTPKAAAGFATRHSSNHPIVWNPDLDIFKAYKFERSVYIALVSQDGKLVKVWPGYSKTMLLELDKRLEELTSKRDKPFDTAYAPNQPASGCQIYEGEGFATGDLR